MSRCKVIAAPAAEPVLLDDAKTWARISHADDVEDALVSALIRSARTAAEHYMRRSLITQTRELVLDQFPLACAIRLPFGPVQSVESLKYIDSNGVEQTADLADFDVDTESDLARILPRFGEIWPIPDEGLNKVRVRYVAGYGDDGDAVPADIVLAIRMHITTHYEHREDFVVGAGVAELPSTSKMLLNPYVIHQ